LALLHERAAGPGVFEDVVRARGAELDVWFVPGGGSPPRNARDYGAIVAFGGPMHPGQEDVHPWLAGEKSLLAEWFASDLPLLGVCLGAQLLAEVAGGQSRPARRPEVGWCEVSVTDEGATDPLLGPLAPGFSALQWHSYEFGLPPAAAPLARSSTCLQAYRLGEVAWGIQFHAEVTLADFESWIDARRSPEGRARLGLEPEPLRERTRTSIGAWNQLGADLCGRFLDAAQSSRSYARRFANGTTMA